MRSFVAYVSEVEAGGGADPFEIFVVVDTHLLAPAHADDHVGGDREIHCRQPDVHNADFGHGGAVGRCDDGCEADALLQDVIAAIAHGDCFELILRGAHDYAEAGE